MLQRPLFLNGFMGSGKSTVARALASRHACKWVDLDHQVEEVAGKPISEIFRCDGEPAFRALERRLLDRCLRDLQNDSNTVVALGGGALLSRPLRLRALESAIVVTLRAPLQTLRERLKAQNDRPLLQGDDPITSNLELLLELRTPAYAEAHAVVDTEDRTPAAIAEEISALWHQNPIAVAAGDRSYRVEIGSGILPRLNSAIRGRSRIQCITDSNVYRLYGKDLETWLKGQGSPYSVVQLEPGEEHKRISSLEHLWNDAFTHGLDRQGVVVGLGGGVVTDMAGFTAACWMRGLPWVGIPTTLLGMVDASVGGKTAVDFRAAKNAVGAFWQPRRVACDIDFVRTESERAYRSALAEVVKTALIGDAELFHILEQNQDAIARREPEVLSELVRRCVQVKASIVSADEREGSRRAVLNLGHTVGHALEAHGNYTEWLHGEAVALGLVAALKIGEHLQCTHPELTARTVQLLNALGLPHDIKSLPLEAASQLIGHDKKRSGQRLHFIVVKGIGETHVETLPLTTVRELTARVGL